MKIYQAQETTCKKLLREHSRDESGAPVDDKASAESLSEIENIVQRTLYLDRTQSESPAQGRKRAA
jgi:hypothetical protein